TLDHFFLKGLIQPSSPEIYSMIQWKIQGGSGALNLIEIEFPTHIVSLSQMVTVKAPHEANSRGALVTMRQMISGDCSFAHSTDLIHPIKIYIGNDCFSKFSVSLINSSWAFLQNYKLLPFQNSFTPNTILVVLPGTSTELGIPLGPKNLYHDVYCVYEWQWFGSICEIRRRACLSGFSSGPVRRVKDLSIPTVLFLPAP
ncbi:13993_t:CDS:2, partial [Entrophospora sp. SA101]